MGGTARIGPLRERMTDTFEFTERELGRVEKSGAIRWHVIIQMYSINLVKIGWLSRESGNWILTDAGRAALHLPTEEFFRQMKQHYREWKKGRTGPVPPRPPRPPEPPLPVTKRRGHAIFGP